MTDPSDQSALHWIQDVLARYWDPGVEPTTPDAADDVFWSSVKKVVSRHRIIGQVYRQIAARPDLVPPEVGRWFGFHHSLSLTQFSHWTEAVTVLLTALEEAEASYVVLKGWWVIEQFFYRRGWVVISQQVSAENSIILTRITIIHIGITYRRKSAINTHSFFHPKVFTTISNSQTIILSSIL